MFIAFQTASASPFPDLPFWAAQAASELTRAWHGQAEVGRNALFGILNEAHLSARGREGFQTSSRSSRWTGKPSTARGS